MIRNSVKLRSLVLTALLVVSVFSGTAAGGLTTAGNVPGEGPSVDTATHYADSSGDPVLELAFTENIDTSSVNETTEIAVTLDDGTTLTVYDDGYQNGFSTRTLESGRLVVDTDGTTYNTVENLTIDGIQDPDGSALDQQTVDVQYAATTVDTTESGSDQNVDAYRGANVSLVSGTDVGTTFDIEGQDGVTYEITRGSGQNSEGYVWETEGRSLGTYNVSDGSDGVNVTLQSLGLSVSMDEDSYETDESVTGTVEADDLDRDVTVELLDDSDDVEDSQTVTIGSDGSADFSFDDVDEGNYTVEAQDIDTRVTDSTDEFAVVDSGSATAAFGQATYVEARGDIVDLTVTVGDTDTATVQIGEADNSNYQITAEVEDDDSDGTVDLTFNSFLAGIGGTSPDDVLEVDDDDSISEVQQGGSFTDSHSGVEGSAVLDAGEYDLLVEGGEMDGTTVSNADNVATLSLTERETGNLTIWSSPGGDFNRLDDMDEVQAFIDDDGLVPTATIAQGDLYAVVIDANGLEGTFDDVEELQDVSEEGRLFSLTYESENEPNADDESYNISAIDEDDVHLAYNDSDDTTLDRAYIFVDNEDILDLFEDHDSGDSYVANFTVFGNGPNNDLDDGNTSVSDSATIEDQEVELDTNEDDEIVLAAAPGQTISGETNLASDTDFTARIRSDGADEPFLIESFATVQTDGTFQTTVNLSEASPGDNFTVQLSIDNDEVGDSYSGYIVEAGAAPPAQGETVTDSPSEPTDDETGTTELSPESSETETEDNETTAETTIGEEGPGFTAVTAAIALIAAALLAARRGD